MQYKKLSIIIPVYNEAATIKSVIEKVAAAPTLGLEKEIIVVDDASTDDTINHVPSDVTLIKHQTNQGKGAALHTGFAAASGDIAIIQDADLEYDPSEIEKVIEPIVNGSAQVVYGSRYLRRDKDLKFWHSFFNKLFTSFGNLLVGQKITDIMTCYKAFSREVLGQIIPKLESKRFGFEPEVTAKISKLGFKIIEVPISYQPRSVHEGKHMNFRGQIESLWALIKYTLIK